MAGTYAEFLDRKLHTAAPTGTRVTFRPDWLFDFQAALVEWMKDWAGDDPEKQRIVADMLAQTTPM